MPMNYQPLVGMQNPQPGLLTAGFNPYAQASLSATAGPQSGLLSSMGPWSQLAYQMAGSPKQGGAYAPVAAPPSPPGSSSTSGGSTAGSVLTGLLGTLANNPGLIKNGASAISGLLGSGGVAGSADAAATSTAGALGGMPVGSIAGAGGLLGADGALTGATVAPIGVDSVSTLPSVAGALSSGGAAGASGGAAAAGSADAGASGAAVGSLGGLAAGVGILAAPLIAGLMTKPVQVDQAYYTKAMGNLTSSDPSARIPAISEALSQPDILQHIQQDNPTLYQQLLSGQAMRDALNAYSAKQLPGGAAVQKGTQRA